MGLITNMQGEGVLSELREYAARTVRPLAAAVALTVLAACQTTGSGSAPSADPGRSDNAFLTDGVDQGLWRSGLEAERAHKYDQAVGAFANLYQRHVDNPQVVAALMRNLRYSGQAQAAIELADRAPNLLADPALHFEYAKALLAGGRASQALTVLEDVAVRDPKDWKVYSATGIAHDALGQFDQAIAAYRTALTLSPRNEVVMNNLAMSQAMSGQLSEAIATLEEAAGYNRTNQHIRQNLALLYAINGDEAKAKALAAMDLNARDLETNLSFYRRFGETGR